MADSTTPDSGINWVDILTKLGPAALNFIGGTMAGTAQGNMTSEQIAENRRQFDAQMAAQKAQNAVTNANTQGVTALGATQMNPMLQQDARTRSALAAALMGNATTGGRNLAFTPQVQSAIAPYTSASARAGADAAFQQTAKNASPAYSAPDLTQSGYGLAAKGLVTPGTNGNFNAAAPVAPPNPNMGTNPDQGALPQGGDGGKAGDQPTEYNTGGPAWGIDDQTFADMAGGNPNGVGGSNDQTDYGAFLRRLAKGGAILGAGAINPFLGAGTKYMLDKK